MTTIQISELPPVLQELAAVIGVDGAMRVAEQVGGTRIYIPSGRSKARGSLLREVLTREEMAALSAAAFAGDYLNIPCAKRLVVVWLASKGLGAQWISRRMKIAERTARRWIKTASPGDETQ